MPTINLGVNYDDIKDLDKFPVLPNGNYECTIKSVQLTNSKKGRPMLKCMLEFIDPSNNQPFQTGFYAVMPWIRPGETETDISGLGNLVGLLKVTGTEGFKPGSDIDIDSWVGTRTVAKVVQVPGRTQDENGEWVNDLNADPTNDIKGFVY